MPRLAAAVGSSSDSGLAGDRAGREAAKACAAEACARPQLDADPLLLALWLTVLARLVWTL